MNMNIKTNSKRIKKGDTFIALKGMTYDGHDYIEEAIENGAEKIICEHGEYNVQTIIVPSTKEYLNNYLDTNYYNKIKDITLIGITGTNGKTTSCYFIYELLKMLDVKCAYIGTIGFFIDKKERDLNNTTPEILELYEMFLECKSRGVNVIVMEVSSHALELDRVHGLKFNYVCFTNLTVDHLLFHKTMDNYLNAKKKLFNMLKKDAISITNVDDKYKDNFLLDDTITYGESKSDFNIIKYKLKLDKTIYKLRYNNKNYKVKMNVIGKYNIYNSLVAIIVLVNMGYNIKKVIKLFKRIKLPSGRLDMIKYKKNVIFVDYAHTPDAVKNVLTNAIKFKKNKIYTIIGCGGNRDKTKRKDMGIIATELSDYVIFTNDNPRNEDEMKIVNDMINGIINENYEVILDRSKAIKRGIDLLNKKDILFILGKGHEEYQLINGIKHHFSDKEEVLNYINK